MNVVIASDHRGYGLKSRVIVLLKEQGHQVTDMGVNDSNSCDYTDVAFPAARAVATGEADLGVLIDGNGIGMSMAANKVRGVRAALCHDELTAEMSRTQNDSNVLCLPGDVLGDELIRRIISTWLSAEFDGSGRHERRVQKLAMIEDGQDPREAE
jgi:ribose 5-phosphate isomerase B